MLGFVVAALGGPETQDHQEDDMKHPPGARSADLTTRRERRARALAILNGPAPEMSDETRDTVARIVYQRLADDAHRRRAATVARARHHVAPIAARSRGGSRCSGRPARRPAARRASTSRDDGDGPGDSEPGPARPDLIGGAR